MCLRALSVGVLVALIVSAAAGRLQVRGGVSPVTYGGVTLVGGLCSVESETRLDTVEVINLDPLPYYPYSVSDNSLTAVGLSLYSCGGTKNSGRHADITSECYSLDTSADTPEWTSYTDLPVPMFFHTASAVGSHIWFVYKNMIHDLDTKTKHVISHKLPFYVEYFQCAVSTGTHVYIIGAGTDYNEIYINTMASNTTEWTKLATLPRTVIAAGCLLFEDQIYISGGQDNENSVIVFDIESGNVRQAGGLVSARQRHGSFVYEGRPAVAGGTTLTVDNGFFRSVETYDAINDTWKTENLQLESAKDDFGLAQIVF